MESVEDHGYLVDIGISATKAFLPKEAVKFNHNNPKGAGKHFVLQLFAVFKQQIENVISFKKTKNLKHRCFLHMCRTESGSVFDLPSGRGEEQWSRGSAFH